MTIPIRNTSSQPQAEARQQSLITLDVMGEEKRFLVTYNPTTNLPDLEKHLKSIIKDTVTNQPQILSKACWIRKGNEDELVFQSSSSSDCYKLKTEKSKKFYKAYMKTNVLQTFTVPENRPVIPTSKPTPPPSANKNNPLLSNSVTIEHGPQTCYLAALLQADLLRDDQLGHIIRHLRDQQSTISTQKNTLRQKISQNTHQKANLENQLYDLETREQAYPDLIALFDQISGKKTITKDQVQQLFTIIAAIDTRNKSRAKATSSNLQLGTQQSYHEVSQILMDVIYPIEIEPLKSPYVLRETLTLKDPPPATSTHDKVTYASSLMLPIPQDQIQDQQISYKTLKLSYFDDLVDQQATSRKIHGLGKYLIVDIKREIGQSKFNGTITDIPGLDDPQQDPSLQTIVCHSGTLNGGHYFVLEREPNGNWIRKDDLLGNSVLNEEIAKQLAHNHVVRLIYKRK